ncbi:MAG: sigma-54 dependent transcriptional regulator [Desulfobacteraceae bacterium]|nr:sigma-54 dependent transcriptional regulator [Desulfobacteraceae bacterium]
MSPYTIFIIDDEETIRDSLSLILEPDYIVHTFANGSKALEEISHTTPDLILLDIGLPDISGIDLLKKIKKNQPDVPVIMITAYEDIETVIAAMKCGAYDYLVKPLNNDNLELAMGNALETVKLRKEVKILQQKFLEDNLPCFIGDSDVIQDMLDFVKTVAKSPDTPILILGETGTGKELIASSIHYRSPNFKGNFVTVNCAAIPTDLIESEIFGYDKGAFSGANPLGKKGLIEEAINGTLFLDEIGDLSLDAQAKLLRFIETGEFYRIGGSKKHHVQTRVVSATNKNLDQMIEKELFRKDLYFRIGVIKIEIPSLNKRRSDILPIANFFLHKFNEKFSKNIICFSDQAENALTDHNWTGNVRELKNIIERGVLVADNTKLSPRDMGIAEASASEPDIDQTCTENLPPPGLALSPDGLDLAGFQDSIEQFYINEAFKLAKGNESKAAKFLGMNHHTYRYKRKKFTL